MCSTWGALKGHKRYFPSGHMKIWKIAKHTPCSQRIALGSPHKLPSTKVRLAIDRGEYKERASCNMRSIGGCIALGQTRQMGTQYNTWHIPHTAQKGSSPHDMSCRSKGITLCQSLIGTQEKFLCNTNTRALHSKVILTHAISWPKSDNANSTLLTVIHYASAHVWRRKAYKAS